MARGFRSARIALAAIGLAAAAQAQAPTFLRVRMLDESGAPVGGAAVFVEAPDGEVATRGFTAPDGRAVLPLSRLTTGATLRAASVGDAPVRIGWRRLPDPGHPSAGTTELRLVETTPVDLLARDPTCGSPVPGAWFLALHAASEVAVDVGKTTADDGTARVGLPFGVVRMWAGAPGRAITRTEARIIPPDGGRTNPVWTVELPLLDDGPPTGSSSWILEPSAAATDPSRGGPLHAVLRLAVDEVGPTRELRTVQLDLPRPLRVLTLHPGAAVERRGLPRAIARTLVDHPVHAQVGERVAVGPTTDVVGMVLPGSTTHIILRRSADPDMRPPYAPAWVSGHARSPSGDGIPALNVALVADGRIVSGPAPTDENGRFRLTCTDTRWEDMRVVADAPHWSGTSEALPPPLEPGRPVGGNRVREIRGDLVAFRREPGEVHGSVTWRGERAAGARIALIPLARPHGLRPIRTTLADRSGRFGFPGVAPGKYRILPEWTDGSTRRDGTGAPPGSVEIEITSGRRTDCEASLPG